MYWHLSSSKKKKPLDVYPTLWMLVALSCLVGSLIGKSLS